MRATLTENGFLNQGTIIQGSYTFTNIKEMGETQTQTVYSAIMKTPISVPCLVTIYESEIVISAVDGNTIKINY